MLEMAQKVVKSVDNITTRPCETLQLVGFVQQPAELTEYKPSIHGHLKCSLRKNELLATIHALMDCLIMYLWCFGETCV